MSSIARRAFVFAIAGGLFAASLAANGHDTARSLGLTIPPALLEGADHVVRRVQS